MSSISGRLRLLFILFFLLVSISAGATFWGLRLQANDALVINLAGRQRMLVQQLTRLADELAEDASERNSLTNTISSFEETLKALQAGGNVHYPGEDLVVVPATADKSIIEQLERVQQVWQEYRSDLELILSATTSETQYQTALRSVKTLAPRLLSESDSAVQLFQERSDRRVATLRWIQVSFFGSALLLLAAGGVVVNRSILHPLQLLGNYATRIGQGDLHTPIEVDEPAEVRLLSQTLESMRRDLNASHQELVGLNQTLESRIVQRTQELDALYEVSQEISSRLDLNHVLQSVTTKARELLKADIAFLCLLDSSSKVLSLRALSGPQETVQKATAQVENPFVQSILTDHQARRCQASGCQGACGILDETYRASHLASSLWVENRVIGALCIGSRQSNAFSDEAPQLLTRLASAAAVAIENARLYAQAERAAALEERQRIAGAIHDGLAQTIDSLGLLVDQANDQLKSGTLEQAGQILERALDRIRQASKEVRQSIANLQDEPLIPYSLQEQLRTLVKEFNSQLGGTVHWQCDLTGQLHLPDEDARQVIGIAQEALTNARRYSGASQIVVRLISSEREATLTIEDNGCGFDPALPVQDGRKHFGLKILQARAAQLSGRLQINSSPGDGACINLTWPIRRLALPVSENHRSINEKDTYSVSG